MFKLRRRGIHVEHRCTKRHRVSLLPLPQQFHLSKMRLRMPESHSSPHNNAAQGEIGWVLHCDRSLWQSIRSGSAGIIRFPRRLSLGQPRRPSLHQHLLCRIAANRGRDLPIHRAAAGDHGGNKACRAAGPSRPADQVRKNPSRTREVGADSESALAPNAVVAVSPGIGFGPLGEPPALRSDRESAPHPPGHQRHQADVTSAQRGARTLISRDARAPLRCARFKQRLSQAR